TASPLFPYTTLFRSRQAIHIYRSLRTAEIIERLPVPDESGQRIRLVTDVPAHFALNQPLSPFALAAMDLLDVESPTHAHDVVSVIEATLDDPRQVLYAQQRQARGEEVAEMKAEGIEYEERMELLEEVTHPQPDRKSTRLNSSHVSISYAVSCLKKKKNTNTNHEII